MPIHLYLSILKLFKNYKTELNRVPELFIFKTAIYKNIKTIHGIRHGLKIVCNQFVTGWLGCYPVIFIWDAERMRIGCGIFKMFEIF